MSVNLVTISVTAEQRDRIYAAYKSRYQTDDVAVVQAAIEGECIATINQSVVNQESFDLRAKANGDLQEKLGTLPQGLPQPPAVQTPYAADPVVPAPQPWTNVSGGTL